MSSNPTAPHPPDERLHALDAVRALALLAGLVLHASMAYLPGAKFFWPMANDSSSVVAALLFYFIHLFRMTTFFLIAGFFGRLLIERMGERAFVVNRLKRILLPLLVGWPLVMTGIVAALVLTAYLKNGGQIPAAPKNGPKFTPDDFPLTHLWFLYALTLLYGGTLVLRRLLRMIDPQGKLASLGGCAVQVLGSRWAILVLAAPLAVALWSLPKWYLWFGIPTPDEALIPNAAAAVAFSVAFAAGWLLGQHRSDMLSWHRHWAGHLVAAIVATAVCLSIAGIQPRLEVAERDVSRAMYAVSYAIATWAWTIGLIGAALRYLDRRSTVVRYLADASYWTYLLHLPIVMALQGVVGLLDVPWPLKFGLVLAITLTLCLGSYQLIVRNTWIGRWLNGPRSRAPGTGAK